MFLSRLLLDPRHPQARRDLGSAYEMHRTLSRAFAPAQDALPLRFLWRQESAPSAGGGDDVAILVQAATAGRWAPIEALPGYLRGTGVEQKAVDLGRLLQPGQRCLFRLRCNPTVTRQGKRQGLQREEDQRRWLERQGQQHGFEVLGARIGRSELASCQQARSGRRITVQVVQFDGVLLPTDAQRLGAACMVGIGHAKALGLGLLSVAPQRDAAYPQAGSHLELGHAHPQP